MPSLNINISPTIDLETHTGGDASPDQDFITFFVKGPFSSSSRVRVQFRSLPNISAVANFNIPIENRRQPQSTLGMASILEVQNDIEDILNRDRFAGVSEQELLDLEISEKAWIIPVDDWQFVTIPKRSFSRVNNFDWGTVNFFGIFWDNTPTGVYCISDILLVGGGRDNGGAPTNADGTSDSASNGGLQGTYKYRITYFNSVTGNRSNPSPATQVAENVNRGYIQLTNLPPSLDTQVDMTEIWRTVGNGDRFFRIARIPDTQATFDDEVADHDTLDSTRGTAVMTTEELPEDNDVPEASFDGCIIQKLTSFWISNDVGKQGRVHFSPVGRPESFKGSINVTPAGDPLHKLVVHSGQRFAFSESTLYRIDGDDPYTSQKVAGVPGVQFAQRRTVVSTPFGLIWQAPDGIRITNGAQSQLLSFDSIGRIFRGEAREGLPAFEGTVATFARGEYFISDGTRTLGIDLATLAWRDVGFNDVTALFYEWDTDTIVGGRVANTQLLEVEGTFNDAGGAIPIEWESPGLDFPNDQILVCDRAFIDMDAGGNTITPAIVHRFGTINLAPISDAVRIAREFAVDELLLKPGIRLGGSATSRVTLFDLELDVTPLSLGINVQGRSERNAIAALREAFPGRYREGLANGELVWEIPRQTDRYDMTDRIFVIDRLTVEANPNGTTITPVIELVDDSIVLGGISGAARGITTYDLDRIGNPVEVILRGDFFTAATRPTVYRLELHLREIELGIRFEQLDTPRVSYPARAPDPSTEIEFEIPPNRREFDDSQTLFILSRLAIDADTQGASFTPEIDVQAGGTITLAAFSTAARQYSTFDINRIGTIHGLRLLGDWSVDRRLFGAELFVRPLSLGLNITTRGNRAQVRGRTLDPTTELIFEVQPLLQELNMEGNLFWLERIVVEANTNGSTITVLIDTDGATITAGTVNTTGREYVELFIQRPAPIRAVRLLDDFTDDVQLFGVEIHVRPVELGINTFGGGRLTHDGKMIEPDSQLVFDVDPDRHELDGVVNTPVIQFLNLELDSGGANVNPSIVTELGTINLEAANTSARETVVYEIQEIGNIQELRLAADFTAGIELYGVEAVVGSLQLGVRICEVQ